MKKNTYTTLIDAVCGLQAKGYSVGFIQLGDKLFCPQHKIFLQADDYQITDVFRFRQDSSPQETYLYAIECEQFLIRGILLEQRTQGEFSLN